MQHTQDMTAEGARYYCWIGPNEELASDTVGTPVWMPSSKGGFAYLFDPAAPKHEPGNVLPKEQPLAHPMNRLFCVSTRQVNSKRLVLMETMKPPVDDEKEFGDYTLMTLQFSYVVCFASVLPLAPLVALITGSIELHTDLMKFLCISQRPEAQKASGIGAWLTLLTCIIHASVPINVLIVFKGYGWRTYSASKFSDDDENDTFQVAAYLLCCCAGFLLVQSVRFMVAPTAWWVSEHELRRDFELMQEAREKK